MPHILRRRGLGLAFWAAMVFGLICILAGVAIDRYGPKLFPPHAPPATPRPRPWPTSPPGSTGSTPQDPRPAAPLRGP